jgi:hypothetical protein
MFSICGLWLLNSWLAAVFILIYCCTYRTFTPVLHFLELRWSSFSLYIVLVGVLSELSHLQRPPRVVPGGKIAATDLTLEAAPCGCHLHTLRLTLEPLSLPGSRGCSSWRSEGSSWNPGSSSWSYEGSHWNHGGRVWSLVGSLWSHVDSPWNHGGSSKRTGGSPTLNTNQSSFSLDGTNSSVGTCKLLISILLI